MGAYQPTNMNPWDAFQGNLQAVSQAQLDDAKRAEIRMKAAAQYGGLGGSPAGPITLTPQIAAGAGDPQAGQRTHDEVQASQATAPQPQMQPPQVPTQAASPQPLQAPSQVPTGPIMAPTLSMEQAVGFRRAFMPSMQAKPHLAFQQLWTGLGGDQVAKQAAMEMIGQGQFSPASWERIQSIVNNGGLSVPDSSQQTGTETPQFQEEEKLRGAQEQYGDYGTALPGQSPTDVGPDQPFAQNLQGAGPAVALGLQKGENTLEAARMRMSGEMQRTGGNNAKVLVQQAASNLRTAMNPIGRIMDPAEVAKMKQEYEAAVGAYVSMFGLLPEFGGTPPGPKPPPGGEDKEPGELKRLRPADLAEAQKRHQAGASWASMRAQLQKVIASYAGRK